MKYFRACLGSLRSQGTLLLELAGGPGMISQTKETKTVRISKTKKVIYVWDQKSFDPVTRNGRYAIHFKLPNGKTLKNAFEYDWRLWTIPETKDALEEAGFSQVYVYWEAQEQGRGTGEYVQAETGDNAHAWIAYIVAVR